MATDQTRYPHVRSERMKMLDEMIDAGWGSRPQHLIPKDWRTRRPARPDGYLARRQPGREEGEAPRSLSATA